MVSKRLKRIRKKLRENGSKNIKVIPQVVTTPTDDMVNALADRVTYAGVSNTAERKPSRKKLMNMRSKNNNEAENSIGSAAMMSRLGYLMANGSQNDMLNQKIQAVQNKIDNNSHEAALEEREKKMVSEEKHNDMVK